MNKSEPDNEMQDRLLAEVSHDDAPNGVPHLEATRSEQSQPGSGRNRAGPARLQFADGGYFQLSHSVFRDPKLRELPGDTFRLYLWLSSQGWRFPDSDGIFRASVSFITEALGMPHATVSRGLKVLKEGRLIRLVETDFKQGNLWWITPRATWSPPGGKIPHRGAPQIEAPLAGPTAASNRGGSYLNSSTKPPQIEAERRNTIPFKKLENSLSQLPEPLQKYLNELQPAKKRGSERAALEGLKQDYSLQDISDCVLWLQQKGIPDGEGTRLCHSPLAFLAKAIAQILPIIKRDRLKAADRIKREEQERLAKKAREMENRREATERAEMERAFEQAFQRDEKQQEVLSELLRGTPFSAKSQAGRMVGLGKWWISLDDCDRAKFST